MKIKESDIYLILGWVLLIYCAVIQPLNILELAMLSAILLVTIRILNKLEQKE